MMAEQPKYGQPPLTEQPLLAPGAMTMDRLLEGEGVMLKQSTSECCRFCCCQPKIHWTLHPYSKSQGMAVSFDEVRQADVWVQEDSGYWGRTCSWCAPGSRKTTYRTLHGNADDNAPTSAHSELTHRKEGTCGINVIVGCSDQGPIRCPCCCYLPYMDTVDKNGQLIGKTSYVCDAFLCVPKFKVEDANGQPWYRIRSDTCCFGCCVRCKCGGAKGKMCRIPFFIRDPHTHEPLDGSEAMITDLWAGFAHECCHRRNMYGLKFPSHATPQQKATLVGAALLMDLALFEQDE
mmetsp:Transcript_17413/g.37878  ORF Transcript_17413/g.37878 Transcript_17413/m.37878 type:complete len:291 (-) Transcript_17413:420-1292(-)|eukprot:CAMPEP_0118929752 /NCGR_PEP_ID=MMETSP1169-20130426/6660_1 /TAXON_ID=36882 /ORGANISM="Pyramimonas obovata, Strain CCMP722" /LENGTH=290 /DNA_ID=CAMNT_0006872001 /DNA_START=136 /DNA_END=1008 /DNA_ORIENTATION=-